MPAGSFYETRKAPSRAIVVHAQPANITSMRSGAVCLSEAVGLAEAIGLEVCEARLLPLRAYTPKTSLGPGQVQELKSLAQAQNIAVCIVNHSLSPTQQRNLERAIGAKVIDRTALILEIFGARAKTAEGKLQVELAALNYQKSRLVRSWTHLERQRGGYGFMGGPGESQIETDRRLIRDRITLIEGKLKQVARTRALHRKRRSHADIPLVALVGYTNAGKSTLFNRLTRARVMAKDMLFATLDPTIRQLTLPSGQPVLLSDTVGFISDLPHELIAAFHATLEEVLEADLLLHVRDIASPDCEAQAADVLAVLHELAGSAAEDRYDIMEVWNKLDALPAGAPTAHPASEYAPVHAVSALTGEGCPQLLRAIDRHLTERLFQQKTYRLDPADGAALAWLYAHARVQSADMDEAQLAVEVAIKPADAEHFAQKFLCRSPG